MMEGFELGKIEVNKKQKKESLLNTAFSLFTSKGFQKTSISVIVNSAGVAKGTFYLYFSDKYDLRNKLIAHKAATLFLDAYHSVCEAQIADFEEQILTRKKKVSTSSISSFCTIPAINSVIRRS